MTIFQPGDRVKRKEGMGTFAGIAPGDEVTVVRHILPGMYAGGDLRIKGREAVSDGDCFELVEKPGLEPEPEQWTPGDGWREVPSENSARDHTEYRAHWTGIRWTYWVQEDPVPSLPTELFTVVRVDGHWGPATWVLTQTGWRDVHNGLGVDSESLVSTIEVLSAPQSVIAAAVLEFVTVALAERRIRADGLRDVLSNARHEFGVTV